MLDIFQKAANDLRQPENWEAFKKKKGALGVPQARKRRKIIERVPIEDALTSELAQFVERARIALATGHFLRLNEVQFQAEALVQSKTRAGRHVRKIDFRVFALTGVDHLELAIEAKPLVTEGDIVGRYLADEGIGCFLKDEPYTEGPLGAMLAYTINNNGQSWQAKVRAAVSVYQPKVLQLEDAIVEGMQEPVTFSLHDRQALGLRPIALLHLELIFASDVQDAPES
ncbi:hypothetical protein [Melittangium boletus]|uniref:hypothetical protein n=1 Tax=Melittangium boletus TaxID=83453 RepID=UPI0012FE3C89|nr:hypothetical protein [Melittangium boletus]